MNILALRSFGDYVILLNSISKSKSTELTKIIVSLHLKELHDSLSISYPSNFSFSFQDFKIKNGILGFFTNKHFISIDTISEIIAIKKYLQNQTFKYAYLEHSYKCKLLSILTCFNFKSIYKQGAIYESLDFFFKSSVNKYSFKSKNYKNILIFPDSRKKEKVIDDYTLSKIKSILNNKNITFKIAKFSSLNNNSKEYISYSNFNQLVQLIKNAEFILSSDSLPVHIAELYDVPHWVLYNKKINNDWLTRTAKNAKYFSTFNELHLLNDFLN